MLCLVAPTLATAQDGTAAAPNDTVAAPSTSARSATPLLVPRRGGPIELDGRLDEAAWESALLLPAAVHAPTFGAEPSERTEFRVAYDDDYLYFGCTARDSDAAGIRAPTLERDDGEFTNDWCVINLDTFNDEETAQVFGTTPAGIRTEAVFPDDGEGAANFSWNTFWDAVVHRDDAGWSAEIRIPLSSLRFHDPDGDGRVVMGMAVWRLIARKNELISWPAISPQWGFISPFKASQFQDVVLAGVRARRPVYVTPYGLGGLGRSHDLNGPGDQWQPSRETVRDVGLDAKFSPLSNLTLDLTLNTDFAQVEADDQQVNLTRFSLFFPEKRLFFQERATVFDFSVGGSERLFHSRRIGLTDGTQVPILGGVRAVGRLGEWDVGMLDMQTAATALTPSENMGVVRVRRRVLNENSYVGGIFTSRVAEAGLGRNLVYGLDTRIRVAGQDYLTLAWAQSFDDDPAQHVSGLGRGLARLAWGRRGVDGLVYDLDVTRVGGGFDPDLGFLFRRDYTRALSTVSYGWRPGGTSPLLRYSASVTGEAYRRNGDGSLESALVQPAAAVELKAGHEWTGSVGFRFEDLEEDFFLAPEARVPAGDYRFATARVAYTPPDGDLFRVDLSGEAGGYFDGRIISASASPVWNASKHLELNGTYSVSAIRFPSRDQAFTAHVARLRGEVRLNTRVSAAAFAQYNSAAHRVSTNVRFRYNPSEGHDLYLVWNEGINSRLDLFDPRLPRSDTRTLLVKYSRTFTFGV